MSLLVPWRRKRQQKTQLPLKVPVVVVGNITVGGTGKTPVIIEIAQHLKAAGFRPGVLARGYGSEQQHSRLLPNDAQAEDYGDEPVLVARSVECPVVVGPDRTSSLAILTDECGCDVVLSDDGLQHYKLPRSFEIVLMDGARGCGNGFLLPVGPLREPVKRLAEVDFVLVNQGSVSDSAPLTPQNIRSLKCKRSAINFYLGISGWRNVLTQELLPVDQLQMTDVEAIAGIGNPARFEQSLKSLGYQGTVKAFDDHHSYTEDELTPLKNKTVLMTEKDAVKCQRFAKNLGAQDWWALQISAQLPGDFFSELVQHIRQFKS